MRRQSTCSVLMVAPTMFCSNYDALVDNHFMQNSPEIDEAEVTNKAMVEFEGLVGVLRSHNISVQVFTPDPDGPHTPDAVFPNNWFSTHTEPETENTMVLYPMKPENRRLERRPEIIEYLRKSYSKLIDLTHLESNNVFLEGTGSMIADRVNKIVYAAVSERTNLSAFKEWAELLGYEAVPFTATDAEGRLIYHTNVMMCVGTTVAVLCTEAISDDAERKLVLEKLGKTHAVVDISREQMMHFCGNVIEVQDRDGNKFLVMSTNAYNAFTDAQKQIISMHVRDILHSDIPTIETVGGGGVRCCIAELY